MKSKTGLLLRKFSLIFLFVIFVAGSLITHFSAGIEIGRNFRMFFMEMILFLPLMFILIGLFDVWVPRERIIRHIGPQSGIWGILWVVLLAMLQAGPLYAAFPVAAIVVAQGMQHSQCFHLPERH